MNTNSQPDDYAVDNVAASTSASVGCGTTSTVSGQYEDLQELMKHFNDFLSRNHKAAS